MMISPFLVKQNLISPLMCEQIVDSLMSDVTVPDTNVQNEPVKTIVTNAKLEEFIFDRIQPLVPEIEFVYEIDYEGIEAVLFEWRSEGCKPVPQCDNSQFLRNMWVRVWQRDVTGIVFLNDYNDKTPFVSDYEVFGSKLEFPQHQFSFNPQRGTLVLYPSGPHFINAFSEVLVGESFVARFHITAKKPYLYDPKKFPGDYKTWFKEFA